MDMTRPSGHDQPEDPIKIQHPEEEEHQEGGASKMFRKVKARAKKLKNNLTKHGNENDQDVDEEDDEIDEQVPEVHDPPVSETSAVRSGVTGQPESLNHAGETNVPAPEEIIPAGSKVFPVVSSDYTKPIEPEPLRDATYGHETPSDREEIREAPSHPVRMSGMSDREESREAHHVPLNTPVSLLSATDDSRTGFGGKSGAGMREEFLAKSHEIDQEIESGIGKDSATGSLTPVDHEKVKETGSTEMKKLSLSGGGSGEDVSATEKLRPGEEDKALWGRLKEEREQGEAVAEEEKGGGGLVGKIKGAYNYYWLGDTKEEVKPKSPDSIEESSQSLGSTVGTKGFSDSGECGLGAVPVQKGL